MTFVAGRPCLSRCWFLGGVLGRLSKEFAVTITVAILNSGPGIGDAAAHAWCSRFLHAAHEGGKRPRAPPGPNPVHQTEGSSRNACGCTSTRLKSVLRHPLADDGELLVPCAGVHRVHVHDHPRRVHSQTSIPDQLEIYTEAAQGTSFLHDGGLRERDRRRGGAGPERGFADGQAWAARTAHPTWAARIYGPIGDPPESPKPKGPLAVMTSSRNLRPQAGQPYPGQVLPAKTRPPFRSAARITRASTTVLSMQTPDSASRCPPGRTSWLSKSSVLAGVEECDDRTWRFATPQVNVTDRPWTSAVVGVDRRTSSENALYDCLRPAMDCRPSMVRWNRVQKVAVGTGAEVPAGPPALGAACISRTSGGKLVPLDTIAGMVTEDRATDHQPLRASCRGHHFVQTSKPGAALGEVVWTRVQDLANRELPATIQHASSRAPRQVVPKARSATCGCC